MCIRFPDSQKRALVRARLKKPSINPDDLNSYRPISNLTFLSKILERVVVRQFMDHADQNDLLPPRQSAYRKFHSTESAVLIVHNDIVCAIDQGQVVALVLLDLSSAFDTVDHPTLLSLLQDRFAVSDQSLSWFHSYLTNRTQILQPHPVRHHPCYSILVSHKDLVLVQPPSLLTLKAPLTSSPHIRLSLIHI